MKLSILDQSPVRAGGTARQALAETIALAQFTEALGYHRFWVSEHHNTEALAGSVPEVLLAAIGAVTKSIRIGTGGIMLPHYSAYKVAEIFAVLSNLYPDRIDMGVGRAPGTDMSTARALASDGVPKFARFPELVQQLRSLLTEAEQNPKVTPKTPMTPPLWMLGSSPDSARLAAQLGLPYNVALFINTDMDAGIFSYYRSRFTPSAQQPVPHTCLTVNVICAETEAEALRLSRSRELLLLRFFSGNTDIRVPSVEEAENYPFSAQERAMLDHRARYAAIGDPDQVREKLLSLATQFGADELMTVTIVYDFAARKRSYQLLAQAFQLVG